MVRLAWLSFAGSRRSACRGYSGLSRFDVGGWEMVQSQAVDARVVAVDVGSVGPPSKFAWAAFDAPGRAVVAHGTDPGTAVSALLASLRARRRTALLLGEHRLHRWLETIGWQEGLTISIPAQYRLHVGIEGTRQRSCQ